MGGKRLAAQSSSWAGASANPQQGARGGRRAMAEPRRADLSADFSTNRVCQDFLHWSFFQSLEGQAGVLEPAVPQSRATCSAHLLHRRSQRP